MLITGVPTGSFQANCYLVAIAAGASCVIVDPGDGAATAIGQLLAEHALTPVAVLLTHGHLDHTAGATRVCADWDVPAYIHPGDEYMLDDPMGALSAELRAALAGESAPGSVRPATVLPATHLLEPGLAELPLTVDHVPGHTPGSVVYRLAGGDDRPEVLFTGDTLFAGSIGRTDLAGGSMPQELRSIVGRILCRPDDAVVAPGHGPTSTVGRERASNPFLRPGALAAAAADA